MTDHHRVLAAGVDAHDPVEAIRLRATRLKVIRGGKIIAETASQRPVLALPGRPGEVSFLWPPGKS